MPKVFNGYVVTCKVLIKGVAKTYCKTFEKTSEKEMVKFKEVVKQLHDKGYKPNIQLVSLEV